MKRSCRILAAVLVALLLCLLPATGPAMAAGGYAYVSNPDAQDRLNLRQEASTQSESLGRFYDGTLVEVLGEEDLFSHVRAGELSGYMLREYLSSNPPELPLGLTFATVLNVDAGQRLHLRTKPAESAVSLGTFPTGSVVQVLGEEGEYLHVRTLESDGYMLRDFLRVDGAYGKRQQTAIEIGLPVVEDVELRLFPDQTAARIVTIPPEASWLTILGAAGTWYYVEWNDLQGYVQRGFVPGWQVMPSNYSEYAQPGDAPGYAVVCAPDDEPQLMLEAPDHDAMVLNRFVTTAQLELVEGAQHVRSGLTPDIPAPGWCRVRADDLEGYMWSEGLLRIETGGR